MNKKINVTEVDDQKIFLNFLNNLKNEEQDLEEINNFFDLANIWKASSPFTNFRSKIDNKMFGLLPAILDDLPTQLELFFIEINKIVDVITFNSENEKLVLEKIKSIIEVAEEKDLPILILYYGKWSNCKKGQEIIFNRIKSILEIKSFEELINFRSRNEWSKPIIKQIDTILAVNLPKILPRVTSVSFLGSFLEKFYYECEPKRLIEERMVEIFQNNFLFSVFSFEKLYGYWKLFSNKSKGQAILKEAIISSIANLNGLEDLFLKMQIVDKINFSIRQVFYEKIINLIQELKKGDFNYEYFVIIILEDTKKRNLPEELIPVFKKKVEEILLNG